MICSTKICTIFRKFRVPVRWSVNMARTIRNLFFIQEEIKFSKSSRNLRILRRISKQFSVTKSAISKYYSNILWDEWNYKQKRFWNNHDLVTRSRPKSTSKCKAAIDIGVKMSSRIRSCRTQSQGLSSSFRSYIWWLDDVKTHLTFDCSFHRF